MNLCKLELVLIKKKAPREFAAILYLWCTGVLVYGCTDKTRKNFRKYEEEIEKRMKKRKV